MLTADTQFTSDGSVDAGRTRRSGSATQMRPRLGSGRWVTLSWIKGLEIGCPERCSARRLPLTLPEAAVPIAAAGAARTRGRVGRAVIPGRWFLARGRWRSTCHGSPETGEMCWTFGSRATLASDSLSRAPTVAPTALRPPPGIRCHATPGLHTRPRRTPGRPGTAADHGLAGVTS